MNARADVSALRIPPQAIEAEQAVLGGILLDNRSYWRVADIIREEDFYRRDHRLIFRSIVELAKLTPIDMTARELDQPFDSVTLGEWLDSQGLSEQIGGTGYLIELASTTPSAANVRAYAEIVREKATMRRLIEAGTEIVNAGFQSEGRSADELIAHAGNVLVDVQPSGIAKGERMYDLAKSVFVSLSEQYNSDTPMIGLSTGFRDIDDVLGGLQPERVYGIGARAKMGKTTLADNIADNVAEAGHHVGKWSLEMSADESTKRSLCAKASINNTKMLRPQLIEEDEWVRINAAMREIAKWPITVFASRARVTLERIQAQATQLKAQGKLELIVVDYLGLMQLPDADRHDIAIGMVTSGLKSLAVALKVPVLLVFQLNRGNEAGGQVRPPRPSDARDSGNIEQDLDVMILLHRPGYYDDNAPSGTRCDIALNRMGPRKVIRLEDDLARNRFHTSDRPWVDDKPGKGKSKALDDGF